MALLSHVGNFLQRSELGDFYILKKGEGATEALPETSVHHHNVVPRSLRGVLNWFILFRELWASQTVENKNWIMHLSLQGNFVVNYFVRVLFASVVICLQIEIFCLICKDVIIIFQKNFQSFISFWDSFWALKIFIIILQNLNRNFSLTFLWSFISAFECFKLIKIIDDKKIVFKIERKRIGISAKHR